ncbi:MAG: response regulator [Planctomycetes bacterium]|nr:response regulator [Planctomycetota bacterium]
MTNFPRNSSKLLLIDDDPTMVRLLSTVIERRLGADGVEVESLTDPQQALTRLSKEVVDIIVTDFDMPNVNGLDVLRVAKQRNACTQVLFITGASSQTTLLEAMEQGATDYLLKPVDQDELIELIRQAQSRHLRWRKALASIWQQQQIPAEATR